MMPALFEMPQNTAVGENRKNYKETLVSVCMQDSAIHFRAQFPLGQIYKLRSARYNFKISRRRVSKG
jgi:hypothetical protein